MTKKASIVFSSAYSYISNPQYFSFVKELTYYKKIYIHVKDPVSINFDDKQINKKQILEYFDEYKQINYDLKNELNKTYRKKRKYIYGWKPYRKYQGSLMKILDDINPEAVISCSDMTLSDRIFAKWCKDNKKKHIILQNAFIDNIYKKKYGFKHKIRYFVFNKVLKVPIYRKQRIYGNENQNSYLLLWSEYFVLDPKRKNTYFVGNAAFDKLFQNFNSEKKTTNVITICTQPIDIIFGQEKFNDVIQFYKTAIENFPNFHFIIKIHPREEKKKYAEIFGRFDLPNAELVKEQNLYDLFKQSIGQISVSSFTSLEALAFGVPIITINPNNDFKLVDHYREEIDIRVVKPEEIIDAIKRIISEGFWEEFLIKREIYFEKIFHCLDEKSSQKTAEQIGEIINE
jgi:glycosyltransferase involved in cell wall biosynthesis